MLVCPLCRIALTDAAAPCPRDGTPGVETEPFELPEPLRRRFRVVEPFGRGDSGTLFLVDDGETGRRGLLKLLHAGHERGRLRKELVRQANLSGGELAKVLVAGETLDRPWLFREWIDGVSLAVHLARGGPMALPETVSVAAAVSQALDELHRAGLVHRDLKTGHVILLPQPSGMPRTVVIDAGVAAPCPAAGEGVVGSAATLAPEVGPGRRATFRSDFYALGCLIHEMLTGTPLYPGPAARKVASHREAPPPPIPSALPPDLAALLRALLDKDPSRRPLSAQQIRRMLVPFLPDEGEPPREPTLAFDVRAHASAIPVPRVGGGAGAAPGRGRGTLRPPAVSTSGVIPAVRDDADPGGGAPGDPAPERAPRPDATVPLDLDELEPIEAEGDVVASSSPGPRWASPPPPRPSEAPSSRPASGGAMSDLRAPPTGGSWTGLTGGFSAAALGTAAGSRPPGPRPTPPPPPRASLTAPSSAPARRPSREPPRPDGSLPARSMELRRPSRPPPSSRPAAPSGGSSSHGPASPPPAPSGGSPSHPPAPHSIAASSIPPPRASIPMSRRRPAAGGGHLGSAASKASSSTPPPSAVPPVDGRAGWSWSAGPPGRDEARRGAFPAASEKPPAFTRPPPTISLPPPPAPVASSAAASAPPPGPPLASAAPGGPSPSSAPGRSSPSSAPGRSSPSSAPVPAPVDPGSPGGLVRTMVERGWLSLAAIAVAAFVVGTAVVATATLLVVRATGMTIAPVPAPPASARAPSATGSDPASMPPPASVPTIEGPAAPSPEGASPRPEPEAPGAEGAVAETGEVGDPGDTDGASDDPPPAAAVKASDRREGRARPRAGPETRRRAAAPPRTAARRSRSDDDDGGRGSFNRARQEGRSHYMGRRYDLAADAYRRATRLNPRHAGSWAGLGAALRDSGKTAQAIQAYERAVALMPRHSGFQAALGRVYLIAGRRTQAVAAYRKALELDPGNAAARTALDRLGVR